MSAHLVEDVCELRRQIPAHGIVGFGLAFATRVAHPPGRFTRRFGLRPLQLVEESLVPDLALASLDDFFAFAASALSAHSTVRAEPLARGAALQSNALDRLAP